MRGAAMSLSAAASGFVVFLLSVSVVPGQDVWGVTYTSTEICALKGSTVDISCTYGYPSRINDHDTEVEKEIWFTKMNGNEFVDLRTDSEYSGRVEYSCHYKNCTLRITDLRESDSAEYKFRFITNLSTGKYTGSPGVTLSVTDLQVQVSRLLVYESYNWVDLKCHSSCRLPDHLHYVWYKNGQKIWRRTSSFSVYVYPTDSYSCAVEGYEKFPSPPVYAPRVPSVSVSPSGEIVEGSSVNLTCSSDANPTSSYTWYKENGNPDLQPLSKEPQLVFRSIQSSDSGEYYCTAENKLGKKTSNYISINVKYGPKPPSVSVSPSGEIVEGSSVNLTCSSDANPAANYTWYKKNQTLFQGTEGIHHFTSISSEDRGIYHCKSENQYGQIMSSPLSVDVQYAPRVSSVSVSPSGEIVEGSSVTLTCSSDANPAATYTWYKKNGNRYLQPLSKEPQLVFRSIQSSDSGEYYCTAVNKLGRTYNYISINVKYASRVPSVSVSPSGEIVEGSSVNLTCSSDANPAANYTWYKKNQTLFQGPEGIHHFTSISSEDRGIYHCKSENQYGQIMSPPLSVDVQYAPRVPSVSVSPSGEIVEGSSVTLTCSSDANPAATYTWYKRNGNRYLQPLSKERQLVFRSIQSSDSGEYNCTAENKLGIATSKYISINVKYAPRVPSVSVSPSGEIVEGSSVTLTCSSDANPAANYTWYKEDEDSPKASGQNFTITYVRPEHSGNYYCEAQNRRGCHNSTLHLTVVAGAGGKLAAAGTITVVLLAIISLSVFLWIRKKRASKEPSDPEERADNREQLRIGQPEEQEDLQYASVHFSTKQADPLYSNIRAGRPLRHMEQQEVIEYAAVSFNRASTAPRTRGQETREDPAALYSTVNRT
ncbi:sialoadhesin-like isoform X1 [Dicentrarchus labrax]|uniref:sialoadhesin-like isoform X1 n=1 Tax=Dicentrarchus labrax TaxID=13489 RepID=UPI0021F62AA2|nr:sialoadhesin-like isoform X1 [Dicentrarchus labrax]